MAFNIFSYYFVSYLFTNCSKEISLLPKVTTPQFLFDLWKLFKNFAPRNALQYPNNFCYRIPGWKRYQNVNMIFCNLTSINLKIKMLANLFENLFCTLADIFCNNFSSILWAPNQMILSFIYRMTCSLQAHAYMVGGKQYFLKPYRNSQ